MEYIIEVKKLVKNYKNIKAVKDISFQVEKGELYGFLGVNGAGKSTTINILCTLLEKTQGDIQICGLTLGKQNEEIRKKIGVVFQDNTLDLRLTVKENLLIRGSLYTSSQKVINNNLNMISEILKINDILDRQYIRLSGGQKRRCEIARALMNTPEILFLDEPTTGLDPGTRQNVWECIEALRNEQNMTVFLTTHYMEEAAKANRIAILNAGEIVAMGTPHDLKQKYATDILRLYPKGKDSVISYLDKSNYTYHTKSNHIEVSLSDSLESIKLLNDIQSSLKGIEVVQGTLDDVFLNITGQQLL